MAPDAVSDTCVLGTPPSSDAVLNVFAEPVQRWFRQRFGAPTPAQRLAWRSIAAGQNLLLCAPTGSGKTLAAFVPILNRLLTQPQSISVRCLYVAPLKALVSDAARNLRRCLEEVPATALKVGVRTGDSSPRARRRLRLQPPDILLTTPESLALLLTHGYARDLFAHLRWLVIDEIHALAANKRGADLALSLERLDSLTTAPPQRIGLSATCAPLETAAHFLVGAGRSCAIAQVHETGPLQMTVALLDGGAGSTSQRLEANHERAYAPRAPTFVRHLIDRLEPELAANRTTLIFTNVRSLAERLVWNLRRRYPDWADQIAVHHSCVAAARRRRVERRLKAGQLRVVVSSTSLELGIDIGSVDGVVLVHPPGGVVRLLQRVGRAGHAPGQPRRGLVIVSSAAELLETVVTIASSQSAQCERLCVPAHPLDVLCQQLLGLAAQGAWTADEAFTLVCRAWPYRDLPRADFDACLCYLAGQHADGEAWLPARIAWADGTFALADLRTARLLQRNLGTILADEARPVCLNSSASSLGAETGTSNAELVTVGQVDEAFADRLRPGDRFLLDGRCLEFRHTDGRALVVDEAAGYPATPRWQGSGWPLSPELAQRLYVLRTRAAEALREGPAALTRLLRQEYELGQETAAALVDFFQRQECVSEIPEATTCLVEVVANDAGADYYVHTPLNRAANDALARVAVLRLERTHGRAAMSLVADLGFLLAIAGNELPPNELRGLLAAADFDADLSEAIANSFSLRERFRCVAFTGLMLLRNPLGRRRRVGGRDWAERQLFDQVRAHDPDFVLLRQARRELCAETIDGTAARVFAEELPRREVRWRRLPQVSPLAEAWTQAGLGPMAAVESSAEALQRLHAVLMQDHQ